MSEPSERVVLRQACPEDAARLTDLTGQLGYETTLDEVTQRLKLLLEKPDQTVYVAVLEDGLVVGWIHLYVYTTLVSEPQAMVGGLVTDAAYRGQGIDRCLMAQAEAWGRDQGCAAVYLKSNVVRKEAHTFYESLGYQKVKSQFAFCKELAGSH
ncbi:MAG: GNAT family N-acetyltransferase [Anaerolineae bacterium]|jgi:GNAT superfamily N-acetyltransferase|nr:GNAT family N-acetyltransferase [Anaerolineae bacterium]